FYVTGETYYGKHGYSLRLDGMDKGVNSNARARAIVVHGADYVSEQFAKQNGRLGRSLGCLALSQELTKEVIDTIKDKSCIFVYYPS
ncbi:MAG: murein L,D-transpeptidase catalytic domain family protein, partial [Lutibacter sp.]|nr:murein L,D-transpeptidase catalytic domain family protein [Lutibacter sp.]